MIKVEGFKAFRGSLRVTPKNANIAPFLLKGDFLYMPDTDCWYNAGRSFMSNICEVVEDLTK